MTTAAPPRPRHLGHRWLRLAAALLTCCALAALLPTAALAQGAGQKAMQQELQESTEHFDMLELDEAETTLREAIDAATQQGWAGKGLADLYVMLGIVLEGKDAADAEIEGIFVNAIETDPRVVIPAVYANPHLEKLFVAAKAKAKPPADLPDGGEVPDPVEDPDVVKPPTVADFTHEPLSTLAAGEPALFEVLVPADMPVHAVVVYYRRFNDAEYQQLPLQPTSNTRFAANLPGAEVRTSLLEYYIKAFNRGGKDIAQVATVNDPISVVIEGGSADIDVGISCPGDPACPEEPLDGGDMTGGAYVMLVGGTDVGFLASGQPTANPGRDIQPGLAPAFGHAVLDAGWRINRDAYLGLYFRFQFSPPQDFRNLPDESVDPGSGFFNTREECLGFGLPGDCLLGLKYRWFFAPGEVARFYSSVGAGVGRVRNWLRLRENASEPICDDKEQFEDAEGRDYCYIRDTVRTGWVHFGVGVGAAFPVTEFMDIVADSYLIVLVPETSVNLDLNAGLLFRF